VKSQEQDGDSTDVRDPANRRSSFLGRLRRDITVTILIKLALLSLLSFLFFSPSMQPHIDASAIATRILPSK
jgi:hypothetical protein